MNNDLLKGQKNTMGRFFSLLWKAHLPYIWILVYVLSSFYITNIGVNVTEYSAELYAGHVDFAGIVLPFLLYSAVEMILGSVTGIISGIATARIDRSMRRTVWKKTIALPYSFYQNIEPKEMISRITNDTGMVSTLIMRVFIGWITSFYSVITLFKQIGGYDTGLMVPLFVLIPVDILIALFQGRMSFGIHNRVNWSLARMTQRISERVSNSILVKSFGKQQTEIENAEADAKDYYKKNIAVAWLTNGALPFHTFAYLIQFILIVLVGRHYYSSGAITLSEWIAYFAFSTQITNTISSYVGDWTTLKSTQGAVNRVAEIVAQKDENVEEGKEADALEGDICVNNISFSFDDNALFENLSVLIPSGRVTALVGPSGSGKTTLLNIIAGLYLPSDGEILIGNQRISELSKKSYRAHYNYITQECVLFSGTLRQNLVYGLDREVEDAELDQVSRKAGILDYIDSLPLRYETAVSENGGSLSGGQRQKLTCARMMLRKADILFMDEATSALDAEAKETVWNSVDDMTSNGTVLYVAHDRQTVSKADYVIVLENGRITCAGDYEDVLLRSSYLADIMNNVEEDENEK